MSLPESEKKKGLVPPVRIERTTRGLGIPPSSHSDNLTPEETTNQEADTVGADGDGFTLLLVADGGGDSRRIGTKRFDRSGVVWPHLI